MNTPNPQQKLEDVLNDLEDIAADFAFAFTQDNRTREAYKSTVREFSQAIRNSVRSGEKSAESAAHYAAQVRNKVMAAAREETSLLGKSIAEFLKEEAKSIEELLEHYSSKMHGKRFSSLMAHERHGVHLEIIEASGRTRSAVDKWAPKASQLGKGIIAFSLAHSAANVLRSRHQADTLAEEISTLVGGFGGAELGALAARRLTGPAAPVFIIAGMFLGGIVGTQAAHNYVKPYLDPPNSRH